MPLSDQWSLATGEENGKIVIYRIRLAAPSFATKLAFPRLLVLLWPFEAPNEKGLPTAVDVDRMTELENLLQTALENSCQGFLSVIVTGNGLREWQWYVRDPKGTMEIVNQTLGPLEPFPVEFNFQDNDPEWAVYERFLDLTGPGTGGL